MTAPRILIFDLDGTLVDSVGPYAELFFRMLRQEYAVPEAVSRPVFFRLMGKGPKAQFDAVLRQAEAWDEARVEDLTRRYWEESEKDVPLLFPEVMEVLQGLRRDGHTLVISTGSIPSSAARKTRQTGIDELFHLILGSDEQVPGLSKGAGHFGMIAGALYLADGEMQRRAMFVGDGTYDMQVAREAGILGVGRLTGENEAVLRAAGAAHVIADLNGLPPLLA